MRKIKLDLDDLQLDSFDTDGKDAARRTVYGYISYPYICISDAPTSCAGACGETTPGDTMCDRACTHDATMCAADTCATVGGCSPC